MIPQNLPNSIPGSFMVLSFLKFFSLEKQHIETADLQQADFATSWLLFLFATYADQISFNIII